MGYYIETDKSINKAAWLLKNANASYWGDPPKVPAGKVPICVVDNGFFEAAAICFNEQEYKEFNSPYDGRPKKWLLIDISEAIKHCPHVKGMIHW